MSITCWVIYTFHCNRRRTGWRRFWTARRRGAVRTWIRAELTRDGSALASPTSHVHGAHKRLLNENRIQKTPDELSFSFLHTFIWQQTYYAAPSCWGRVIEWRSPSVYVPCVSVSPERKFVETSNLEETFPPATRVLSRWAQEAELITAHRQVSKWSCLQRTGKDSVECL